jgi:hypothetical protein
MAVLIVAISFQSLEQEKESIGLFENVIFCRFSVITGLWPSFPGRRSKTCIARSTTMAIVESMTVVLSDRVK